MSLPSREAFPSESFDWLYHTRAHTHTRKLQNSVKKLPVLPSGVCLVKFLCFVRRVSVHVHACLGGVCVCIHSRFLMHRCVHAHKRPGVALVLACSPALALLALHLKMQSGFLQHFCNDSLVIV